MLVDSPELMSYDTTDGIAQFANERGENYEKVFVREWGRRLLMAEIKKPEINKAADTKTSTVTTPVAAPAAKTETAASTVKTAVKTETKTEAAKAPAEKKKPGRKPAAAKKPGRKPAAAKKETAKTAAAKKTTKAKKTTTAAKKTAVKENLHLEFAGKSYTTEELVKIAKDVWKYDLKRKVGDFKSVELYVKPEESVVYYVINGDVAGNFGI